MEPFKPLYLNTYGRQRRKISTWIFPEDRKQVFDSTVSTDDMSVFEPPKPKRPREKSAFVGHCRKARLAKKKAMQCLGEKSSVEENMSDEENIIPSTHKLLPAQQSRATKGKRTSVRSGKAVRSAKTKAVLRLIESSSSEDNSVKPSSTPMQRRKTTKKSQLVSAQALTWTRGQGVAVPSETDEEEASALKDQKMSAKVKEDSKVRVPSAGRFVTHRRRVASTKLQKAIASILCSSDEFTSAAFHRPSKRRRAPPGFGQSSADSSADATGVSSITTNPFRETSLNESADHILGPCPRKPIFCSTPSAGSFPQRGHSKIFPTHIEVTTPPSSIGVLTTFQEDLVSPQQPESVGELNSKERQRRAVDVHHNDGLSVQLLTYHNRGSCSGDSKSEISGGPPNASVLSADGVSSSSHFVSAAGGLEWLMEALKEKCLSQRCTVQLERLDHTTVTQLCSQTTYSSCLELSSAVHSQKMRYPADGNQSIVFFHSSEESINHLVSVASDQSDYLETSATGVADVPASARCKKSAERVNTKAAVEELESVLCVGSFQQTDQSCEVVMNTPLPAGRSELTGFTGQEIKTVKGKKCTIRLHKLTSSQIKARHLRGGSVASSESDDKETIQNEKEHVRCPGRSTGRVMASVAKGNCKSREASCAADRSLKESKTSEIPGGTAVSASILRERCLTDRLVVQVEKKTFSQLKEVLHPKDASLKSSRDVSEIVSDKTMIGRLSESDCKENKTSWEVSDSACSESKTSSANEAEKNSRIVAPKRKKASQAPKEKKRRSTSTDQSGITRKVCVSGMSTSRWKTRGADAFRSRTAQMDNAKAGDCSISELISKKPAKLGGTTMSFFTPVRASQLNVSSLLADLTPNTHTWSRLKAALSVHRKGMVQLTPRNISLSSPASQRRTALADLSRDLFSTPLRTPLPRRLQSQLLSQYSLSADVCEDSDLSDAEKVYAECSQQRPLPWEECIPHHCMKRCVKIGEGTFGEVFSTTKASGETVALKVIPVEGSEKVNGEDQKTFGEILHEIIISKELSSLKEKQQNQTHGFIGLNDLHCVQGVYPPDFLKAWDTFDQRKISENDRPDFFEKDQLFIILEFEFGGVDLENSNGTLASLGVAKSILHQVTAALAVAEQELHFEHRDLHWGNVLVKTTKQKTGSFLLNGTVHSVETKGVLVRIIDYSLSRLEIDDLTVSCDISNDEDLFMGQGDYQFDIYRLMRQENRNNWSSYHPRTNVLWLHYLCSKLLSMKYRGTGGRSAKNTREELTCFYDNVLQYSSATEVLQTCPVFQ